MVSNYAILLHTSPKIKAVEGTWREVHFKIGDGQKKVLKSDLNKLSNMYMKCWFYYTVWNHTVKVSLQKAFET